MGELLVRVFPAREPVVQSAGSLVASEGVSAAAATLGVASPAGGAAEGPAVGWSASRRAWWVLWSRCPGIGWVRLRALEALPGGLEAAWSMPLDGLRLGTGWSTSVLVQVDAYRQRLGEAPLAAIQQRLRDEAPLLLPGDPAWPPALGALQRPPLALHWQGQGRLWPQLARRQAVAVVGTRRPSLHGRSMARRLGEVLARAGWPVVSGLAEGIDAAVHRGCLEAGGAPVAVLGTPLARVYPRHHALLQGAVAEAGLLISESPPGTRVMPGHFAARNRLQVALARAVVVVECPISSGALHSASIAWQQGLPLYVVPADAGRVSAQGSNRLLSQGATPLLDPADLLAELGNGPLLPPSGPGAAASAPSPSLSPSASALDPDRRAALLRAVGAGASLEQLSLRLDQPPAELMLPLLDLELAGHLRAEAGLCWSPCSRGGSSE
ncbi:MAG: hypothetical protein RLZZ624_189 [Cyanobacteriota bacterium]